MAFKRDLIDAGDVWMEMVKSRTLTSYTYNEEISDAIYEQYYPAFIELQNKFKELEDKEQE